jgi:hypothetical protein
MIVAVLGCLLAAFEFHVARCTIISPIWGISTLILSVVMFTGKKTIFVVDIIGFSIIQALYMWLKRDIFSCIVGQISNSPHMTGSAHMWDSFCLLSLTWDLPIIVGNLIILIILVLQLLRWNNGRSALTKEAND